MQVTLVHVRVKPEHLAEFIEITRANHEGSVKEPGNRRFDVLQAVDDPCRFVLHEVFVDPAAVAAHKETAHYKAWRDMVADWMSEPRQGVKYRQLFPVS